MKLKALLTAALLATTNLALANGGLTIDNVEQTMNANNWVNTQTERQEIVVQGPIDAFDVITQNRDRNVVDTNKLKQAYDGQV
ncbi:MAG: hypothetical protein HKN83_07805 [Gammaproteobacteria bacterium]|nr:hypothetical protein [Gammaproteobacteria bacterium]